MESCENWMAASAGGAPVSVFAITGEEVAPYILILGLMLVTASLITKLAKRRRGGSSPEQSDPRVTGAERLEKLRQEQGVRRDLDSLMVEIEEMAKRISHQLDAKALRLEQLIEDADHRLTRLRHVAERLESVEENAQPSGGENTAVPHAPPPGPAPPTGGNHAAGSSENAADPAEGRDLLSASSAAARGASEAATPPTDDPLTRSVYALADEGHDAQAIAARLREHTGKVELMLALREE